MTLKARSIKVDDVTWERLGAKAKAEGTNISAVIKALIDNYLGSPSTTQAGSLPDRVAALEVLVQDLRAELKALKMD